VLISDADYCEGLYQLSIKYKYTVIIEILPRNLVIIKHNFNRGALSTARHKLPESLNDQIFKLIDQHTEPIIGNPIIEAIHMVVAEYKDFSLIKGAAAESE
jgi:hypothetical protein